MRPFHLARRLPRWLRVALAGLLIAFALNSIAHVAHRHEATSASVAHALACGYCATFGGLADAPRHGPAPAEFALGHVFVAGETTTAVVNRVRTSARPRAPPLT
jgi:hypothetical protein